MIETIYWTLHILDNIYLCNFNFLHQFYQNYKLLILIKHF